MITRASAQSLEGNQSGLRPEARGLALVVRHDDEDPAGRGPGAEVRGHEGLRTRMNSNEY